MKIYYFRGITKVESGSSVAYNQEVPPQFTMRLRDRRVQMTYPVRLTCQVAGWPKPEVVWSKDGHEVLRDGKS